MTDIHVLAERTWHGYTIQAYRFGDTWQLESPAPPSYHPDEIVYRVMKDGSRVLEGMIPRTAARIGSELVKQVENEVKQMELTTESVT